MSVICFTHNVSVLHIYTLFSYDSQQTKNWLTDQSKNINQSITIIYTQKKKMIMRL